MTAITRQMRIRHSPDDIFALISDVESYPRFINLISVLRITKTTKTKTGRILVAEAIAHYKMVKEKFVTEVVLNDKDQTISVGLVKGPFKSLANHWKIRALSDGSALVDFEIDFKFSSSILNLLLSSNQNRAINLIINAFKAEADRLYPIVGDEELDLSAELEATDNVT